MRKRLVVLAAAAAPLVALTIGVAPAHADYSNIVVVFEGGAYCLDIPGNNAVVGQHLQAWTCNNSDAQIWNYIKTDSYHFELQSKTNPSLCANNWQGGDNTGNDIKLYYCNGNADGTWNWVGDPWLHPIQPRSALNTCLNIWGGLANGNPAKLYPCSQVDNEDIIIPQAPWQSTAA
ncbi:RICIN domain-containing protein [Streptacidiphilus rugosus]|uniref:RICIN domain-containing protein n=1 Tax=Streptacidiphilus rugosus TaxID=405783 RepID=UPI00055B3339|nr:RICIN domain-containing protein [Streptacidiphilus rugosus]